MRSIKYEDLLGKSFEFGARGPESFDCWGLCLEVCSRAGIDLPREYTPAEMTAMNVKFDSVRNSEFIKLDKPKPYSIVVFKMPRPVIWHAGVVLSDCNTFIHIMRKRSVSIERLDNITWTQKLDGFYELNY